MSKDNFLLLITHHSSLIYFPCPVARLDDVQADDARAQQPRELRRHRYGVPRALAEVCRQQDRANVHKEVVSSQ